MRRAANALAAGEAVVLAAVVLTVPSLSSAAIAATSDPASTASQGVASFGRTHDGRQLRIAHRCADDATVDVLVVGAIHGTETAGRAVVRRLGQEEPPAAPRSDPTSRSGTTSTRA